MTKERNYRFSILVRRPDAPYTQEELDAMPPHFRRQMELMKQYPVGNAGTVYIQLDNPYGSTITWGFGIWNDDKMLAKINIEASKLLLPVPGKLHEKVDGDHFFYHDRIDYPITSEEYGKILTYLEKAEHDRHLYHRTFHNCVNFALETADRFNMETPPHGPVVMPTNLSTQIMKMAEQYDIEKAEERLRTLEFSESAKIPPIPVTLLQRAKEAGNPTPKL